MPSKVIKLKPGVHLIEKDKVLHGPLFEKPNRIPLSEYKRLKEGNNSLGKMHQSTF